MTTVMTATYAMWALLAVLALVQEWQWHATHKTGTETDQPTEGNTR